MKSIGEMGLAQYQQQVGDGSSENVAKFDYVMCCFIVLRRTFDGCFALSIFLHFNLPKLYSIDYLSNTGWF